MMLLRRRPRPAPEPPGQEVPTLVLKPALEELAWRSAPRVLDLGPAVTANVERFAAVEARVHVADLHSSLLRQGRPPGSGVDWQRVLPPRGESFDLILAWDLLNYLNPEEITTLARELAYHCRRETLLMAAISIRDPLPPRPGRYELTSLETMRCTFEGQSGTRKDAGRPSPRYRELQLLRWLEGFTVRRAFLLRHGVQEYLFAYEATPPENPAGRIPPP